MVLAERHNAPVVDITLIVDAGYAADSLAKPGTARLALNMLDEGTKKRNSLQIAERAELLGARLGAGSSLDTSFISLNAITHEAGGFAGAVQRRAAQSDVPAKPTSSG